FAPESWEIDAVEKGDLNGDKIDDAVIVMTKPEVMENDKIKEYSKRFLVLAFGDGGQFKRAAFSAEGALDNNQEGTMGDLDQEVAIKNGVVFINYRSGGRIRQSFTKRYRWQKNRLMLIGNTYETYDGLNSDAKGNIVMDNTLDTNLSTG